MFRFLVTTVASKKEARNMRRRKAQYVSQGIKKCVGKDASCFKIHGRQKPTKMSSL